MRITGNKFLYYLIAYLTNVLLMTTLFQQRMQGKVSGRWPNSAVGQSTTESYVGWFGVCMIPCLLTAHHCDTVDIDRIKRTSSSALCMVTTSPSSKTVSVYTSTQCGKHQYRWWLYNGGPYQLGVLPNRISWA